MTVMNGVLASRFRGFGARASTTAETCSAVPIAREAVLEIRIHRDTHGVRDLAKMLERLVAPHAVVGARERPGVPGARRRQRLEAHLLERDGGADVPRVRYHEAALGVQPV